MTTRYNSNHKNTQDRNSNPHRVHLAPPAHIEKQRDFVLRVLRQAGIAGINRDDFLTGNGLCNGRRCTQVGARLDELTKMGFIFESKSIPGKPFVQYYLRREPQQPAPAPVPRGWKAQTFSFGIKQPQSVPAQENLGLYDSTVATGTDGDFTQYETGHRR